MSDAPTPARDYRDFFALALVLLIFIISTVYLIVYHSESNFATWATVCATVATASSWVSRTDGDDIS